MASLKTKFTVGLFVLVGMAIALAMITWLGMSHYFEEGKLYVTYFDESVQGLDKDSPVKYRGVPVGRVDRIGVAPDSTLIEVVLKIESGLKLEAYTDDLTAQLKSVGITGIMFIGLDRKRNFDPDRTPKIGFVAEHPVIASIPSDIKKYMEGLEDVLDQLSSMDVKGISTKVKAILSRLDQTVSDAQVKQISADFRNTLARLDVLLGSDKWHRILDSIQSAGASFDTFGKDANSALSHVNQAVVTLNRLLSDNAGDITAAIRDFQNAMKTADAFMGDGAELVRQTHLSFSTLLDHLLVTEQNIAAASESLRRFMSLIADQPSQLILGEPAPARRLEDSRGD